MDFKCKHCGTTSDMRYARITEDGDMICTDCYEAYYVPCNNCGAAIKASEDRRLCKDCSDIIYRKPINSYSTKPFPVFKGKKYNDNRLSRFYGLELEYSYTSAIFAYSLFNKEYKDKFLYNKSDSSLDSGVEIVTSPLDKQTLTELLGRMNKGLSKVGSIKNYNKNAGIHIHVNRASIDSLTVYKLSYLLNMSATEDEKRIIYYISGRNRTSTTETSNYHYAIVGDDCTQIKACKPGDRYRALNLNNSNTIEFRMFASTTKVENILMYVDFVDDLIEYASKFSFKNMNISSFISWEKSNCKNNLIKRRINNFERHNNTFNSKENKYALTLKDIKGVNIKYWDKIIFILNTYPIPTAYSMINKLKVNPDGIKISKNYISSQPKGRLQKVLEKTLSKVLINKIIKEQKQCA